MEPSRLNLLLFSVSWEILIHEGQFLLIFQRKLWLPLNLSVHPKKKSSHGPTRFVLNMFLTWPLSRLSPVKIKLIFFMIEKLALWNVIGNDPPLIENLIWISCSSSLIPLRYSVKTLWLFFVNKLMQQDNFKCEERFQLPFLPMYYVVAPCQNPHIYTGKLEFLTTKDTAAIHLLLTDLTLRNVWGCTSVITAHVIIWPRV